MGRRLYLSPLGALVLFLAVWLGYQEMRLKQLHGNSGACKHLKLGEEDPHWESQIKETLPRLEETLEQMMDARVAGKADDPDPQGRYKRVQHPVAWGCAKGTLEIFPKISEGSRFGLFASPGNYSAVVRLSKNGFNPDRGPKVTGVALKIFGVQGRKATLTEHSPAIQLANVNTQDFIMMHNPTFPILALPQDLNVLFDALNQGKFLDAFFFLALNRPTLLPRAAWLLFLGWRIKNPLTVNHYTVHPSKLGEGQAARIALFPCDRKQSISPTTSGLKDIHDIIQDHLNQNDACMNLMIQKQTEPCADRVDDILSDWVGPWEHVGILRIPKGSRLDTSNSCDDLSFNPFHALEDNRPVGWVARLRRDLYSMQAARRFGKNHEQVAEVK